MKENTFIEELEKLNITPTIDQLQKLKTYKELLIEYNELFNLTAITKEDEIYLKHFYDSLTITKVIDCTKKLKVLDIGTGAGFPGLVLKILFPNLEITLLDSNNKKITFLNTVIEKLQLANINTIHSRAEELDKNYIEYFDVITSRAVAHLRILLEIGINYLKVNGNFVLLKGNIEEELQESLPTIKVLKCKVIEQSKFKLPVEGSTRAIIKLEKMEKTPKQYPRKYNQIKKCPIKD